MDSRAISIRNTDFRNLLLNSVPSVLAGAFIAAGLLKAAVLVLVLYLWALLMVRDYRIGLVVILMTIPLERNNTFLTSAELVFLKYGLVFSVFFVWLAQRSTQQPRFRRLIFTQLLRGSGKQQTIGYNLINRHTLHLPSFLRA